MKRTTQINIRFTPEELAAIDAICTTGASTGLESRSRSAVIRAAVRIYLETYRITGEPPIIADAVAALTEPRKVVRYDIPPPAHKRRA